MAVSRPGSWVRRMGRALVAPRGGVARASDRVQAFVVVVFVLLVIVAAPFAAEIGAGTAGQRTRQAAEETAARHEVSATLLADAPPDAVVAGADGLTSGPAPRAARWRLPGGDQRVGQVDAGAQLHAGDTVAIWVDRAGNHVPPPLDRPTAVAEGVLTGFGLWAGLCVALALLYGALVAVFDRRRLKRWQHDWAVELDRRTPS